MSRISAAIAVMNPEEILAAFDEIPKTNPSRTELEDLLLAPLVKLAPELALERLGDRITSDPSTFDNLLADALCALTKTDPKKAAAWLDDKIDKGLFDSEVLGKPSQGWWRMESALIRAMLVTNPTEASRRAAGIDPKNREHILMSAMHSQIIEPAEQAAYGKLCREFLDDEKMLTIVGWMSVELRQDSYQEISAFWDRFGATRKERATVAAQVARKPIQRMVAQSRKVTPEDLDAMRAWVTSEGSRKVETITGGAIGEVANSKSAGIAEAMVLFNHYYEGNPNDGLIVGFLGWPVVQADKPLFQSLFQKLSNDRVRANLLKDL